jgi:cysteine desulfurase
MRLRERKSSLIYLDWAASAPPEPEALDEARDVLLRFFANPSSAHSAGKEAEERLEDARARFGRLLRAEAKEMVFTSGGTESNCATLLSLLDRHRLGGVERQKTRLVTTTIEHASVYEQARSLQGHGVSCVVVPPRPDGIVTPQAIADSLDENTAMVSVMLVNNETGAVQDLAAIARAVREFSLKRGRKILLHTDAVQALGKMPIALPDLDVDAASFSGHKIGGPRGIGALYLRTGAAPGFLTIGGGQEGGRRPGTENLPGVRAMTVAAEKRMAHLTENLASARDNARRLISGLRRISGAWIIPAAREDDDPRYSPFIVCAGFPPLPAEIVVRIVDGRGFCISAGSACSSRKKDRTRVPESMGLSHETALSAIRISMGPSTTSADIDAFLSALKEEIPPLLAISKGRGA